MIDKIAELPMFFGKNIINGIFMGISLIILIRLLLKQRIETVISLEIIRWVIISYCFVALFSWFLLLLFPHSEKYAFIERATGPYAWAYWLMFLMNCVVPLILLNKKIGKKIYIVFSITLFMNIGWILERFVMIMVSFHRDPNVNYTDFLLNYREVKVLIQGIIVGLISLIIGNGINKWRSIAEKRTHNNTYK